MQVEAVGPSVDDHVRFTEEPVGVGADQEGQDGLGADESVVDEPFVGLDQPGKLVLLELLDEVRTDGAATVVATHDPAYVDRVDRSIALRDGEVVFDGTANVDQVLGLVGG